MGVCSERFETLGRVSLDPEIEWKPFDWESNGTSRGRVNYAQLPLGVYREKLNKEEAKSDIHHCRRHFKPLNVIRAVSSSFHSSKRIKS